MHLPRAKKIVQKRKKKKKRIRTRKENDELVEKARTEIVEECERSMTLNETIDSSKKKKKIERE